MGVQELFSDDVIKLFNDNELFEKEIHNLRSNRFLFRDVYNTYLDMCKNNIEFDSSIMRKIIIMSTIYTRSLKNDEIPNKIRPIEKEKEVIQNKILNMRTISDIDSFDRYYKTMKSVTEEALDFTLEEQYKTFDGDEEVYELNGVSVITPSQTVSRYNAKSMYGEYGVGYHEDNFKDIFGSIYGRDFNNNYSGQDIKIRFVNSSYKGNQYREMTIEVPLPINSSQLVSLSNLNRDLKVLQKGGIEVNIDLSIIDKDGFEYYNNRFKDLDKILPNLIIDDYIDYEYEEEFFVGQINYESNFFKERQLQLEH